MPLGATIKWRNINDKHHTTSTRMPYGFRMDVRLSPSEHNHGKKQQQWRDKSIQEHSLMTFNNGKTCTYTRHEARICMGEDENGTRMRKTVNAKNQRVRACERRFATAPSASGRIVPDNLSVRTGHVALFHQQCDTAKSMR